ncbi:hypothetical protein CRG98_012156 [Punica granatum]|uniref:Uncharacterized protein n=1 Tax=Punica granatum TaxID=22663 RepID=A0A2I0KGE7_PUNGR|nr:hypothetical protein CRG98_012156 [Punica granatum]
MRALNPARLLPRVFLHPCAPHILCMHACTSTSRTFADNQLVWARASPRMPSTHDYFPCLPASPTVRLSSLPRLCMLMHIQLCVLACPDVLPLHPNVLPRIPPSHLTLKPFLDSFLVSRG